MTNTKLFNERGINIPKQCEACKKLQACIDNTLWATMVHANDHNCCWFKNKEEK